MRADLNLKRPDTSPSREWGDHDFDVLADDVVVGRIMKTQVAPPKPWLGNWSQPPQGPLAADVWVRSDARRRDGGVC
jgi:hypothetical protein